MLAGRWQLHKHAAMCDKHRMMHPSAHVDTFTRDNLPSEKERPVILHALPGLDYPATLNCVDLLLDRQDRTGSHVATGQTHAVEQEIGFCAGRRSCCLRAAP